MNWDEGKVVEEEVGGLWAGVGAGTGGGGINRPPGVEDDDEESSVFVGCGIRPSEEAGGGGVLNSDDGGGIELGAAVGTTVWS
jgi:hypothetical protein